MKKLLLRPLSVVALCIAIALIGGAKAWALGPNLMTNPGFEESTTDQWNVATNFAVTSSTAHTGSYSLQCNLSETYQNADEYANVWQSTNYTSSVWVKGSGTFTFQIENQGWSAALASTVITATSTWTKYTLNWNSGTNTTVEIMIWDGDGTGTAYCDDFTNGVTAGADLGFNPSNPSASGLSYVWGDEFANANTIDSSASGGNNYHWYPQQWYGYGATPSADIPVSGGALDLDGDPDNITTLNTAFPKSNSSGYQGTSFGAGGASAIYFEARMSITDPEDTGSSKYGGGWPAFWMNSLQGDTGIGNGMPGVAGYNEWIEQDFMEYNATFGDAWSYGSSTHDWVTNTGTSTVYDVAQGSPMCLNANNNLDTFFAAYHTYGLLWVPATSANGWIGYRQPFFDGVAGPAQTWVGDQDYSGALPPTFTSMGNYFNSLMDSNTYDLMIGTGVTGPEVPVDYVHVFSTTVNSVTVVQASGSSGHPPAGPTSLHATGSSGSVSLGWTAGSGASSYNIYRGTSAGGESATAIGTSSTTSYTDSTVTNGTTYYYYVAGVNTYAVSVPSNEASATPSGGGGGGTIALVQSNYSNPTSGSSVSVAYSSSQTAGNMNIIAAGSNSVSNTISSVTDSQGNTYTKAIGPTASGGTMQYIYYAPSIKAGSNTVTVTYNASVSYPDVRITEYSGVTSLDTTVGASGSSASAASGSLTTTNANDLLFAATDAYPTTTGFSSGYTDIWPTSGDTDGNSAAYDVVTSTGSYSCTGTLSGSGYWVIQLAAFKGSSGGGSAPAAPTGLTATPGNGSVGLGWSTDSGATSYSVYRGTSSGGESGTAIASGIGTTSYTDSSVTNGTTYYYKIKASNSYGTSGYSGEANARPVAPIALKQDNYSNPTSGTTVTCAYGSSQTAGDMNIVAVGSNSISATISSVTDSQGNTYTKAVGLTTSGGTEQSIYYAPNIKSGSNTVSVTYSASVGYPDVRIAEFSGVYALDKTAAASGTSSSPSSGSVSTTQSRELLFTATECYPTTTGFGSGFTDIWSSGDTDGNSAAYDSVTSTGSYSGTATLSSSNYWVIQLITLY